MSAYIQKLRGEERAAIARYLRSMSLWDLLRDWRLIRRMAPSTFKLTQYLDDPFGPSERSEKR